MGSELVSFKDQLDDLLSTIRTTDTDQSWDKVRSVAQAIANRLRVRDAADSHAVLGKSDLPQLLTTLLSLALRGAPIPTENHAQSVFELLRVAANLCMDHDENRSYLLEAGFPQAVVSLLEGYAESISVTEYMTPLALSIIHLKVIRTAIGVLLNASIGYEPVKFRLISLEAAMTILKLSTAIYPASSWSKLAPSEDDLKNSEHEEEWNLRSGIANWAWRVISELKDVKDETLQIFNPDVLPLLTPPLLTFCIPYPSSKASFAPGSTLFASLLDADLEALEEICALIESLSLDVEDIRLALARGFHFPAEHSGVRCLNDLLTFVEKGDYPPQWTAAFTFADLHRRQKAFDICKAAVIKAVVEVAGEESNADVLWEEEDGNPGGKFVSMMVDWIKQYVALGESNTGTSPREDLVICATLSLGNLARRERNSTALLMPPHNLAPILSSLKFFSPSTDIKIKHGILGLLKHLAQSSSLSPVINKSLLEAGIIRRIAESGIWDGKSDAMADIVQLNAVGVVKHLCNASVDHSFALVLPEEQNPTLPTGLTQILALVERSDSVPIKSEGTRVLVNVIKSLCLYDSAGSTTPINTAKEKETHPEKHAQRQLSMTKVLTPECTSALASLVGRSGRYPILVNEGIVALSLLSTHPLGGSLVLKAICAPLTAHALLNQAVEPSSASTSSDVSSPLVATPPISSRPRLPVPRNALDMIVFVLRNVDNQANFPVEVRLNACSLLTQIRRHTSGEKDLATVKEAIVPVLEKIPESQQLNANGKDEMLNKAAKRVLDTWVQ